MATLLEVLGVHDIRDVPNPLAARMPPEFKVGKVGDYLVVSFNNTLDLGLLCGFAFDTTGADPDLYFQVPGRGAISVGAGGGMNFPGGSTADRDALVPATGGLLFYNSDTKKIDIWTDPDWEEVTSVAVP